MTPRERALGIVARGGQILLPFKAGDAEVTFSRWELARLITETIEEAVKEERGHELPA